MKLTEIKKKAQEVGVVPGKMIKVDLVRAIQKKEGNSECYHSGKTQCDRTECCWREDCLPG